MKKNILIIIIVIVVIIIGYIVFFDITNNLKNGEKSVHLGINDTIKFLDECIEQSKLEHTDRDYDYLGCTEEAYKTPLDDIEKLRLLKDLEGIKICEYSRGESSCDLSSYSAEECEKIWGIEYYTMGVKPCQNLISIFECGSTYYFYYSYVAIAGPSSGEVYKIQLSEDFVNGLKE